MQCSLNRHCVNDLWTVTVELQRQSILHLMTEFIGARANRRMQ